MEPAPQDTELWVEIISQVNKVFWVVIALGCAFGGYELSGPLGGLVGLLGGGVAATVICGPVALMVDIRRLLQEIREDRSSAE